MEKIVYIVNSDIDIKGLAEYENEVFYDGIKGIRAIKDYPLIVLLDLGLKRVTAFDILNIIRSNPHNRLIKIVVCSRNYNLRMIKKAFVLGADFYLPFPIDYEKLDYIVSEVKQNLPQLSFLDETNLINLTNLSLQNKNFEV